MKSVLRGLLSLALLTSTGAALASGSCCPTTSDSSCKTACSTSDTKCSFYTDCCDSSNRCCNDDTYFNHTHYSLRPQGTNNARLLMGTADKIHMFGREEFYGVASIAFEYGQTFDGDKLATWFSPNCSNQICFGPDVGNDTTSTVDVRAIDFGLSPTFKGCVCLAPEIKNFVVDLDFWFGLDEFVCGLWARLDIPLVYTRWEMALNETVNQAGGKNYGLNTVTASTNADQCTAGVVNNPEVVYKKISEAWCGDKKFGDAPALRYGKLCCKKDSEFHVSGVRFDLGYDFFRRECGYFGAGVSVVAGVGTRAHAEHLFQPVVGAQRAWQLGLTWGGGYRVWERDEDSSVSIYGQSSLVHLFREQQTRLFGLKENGPWSHYLLLKKFKDDNGTKVYDGLERAANILACEVKVKANIMADSNVMVAYRGCNFGAGIGGGIWYRSCEKIDEVCGGCAIAENTYGIAPAVNTDATSSTNIPCGGDVINMVLYDDTTATVAAANPKNSTASKSTIKRSEGTAGVGKVDTTQVFLKTEEIDPAVGLHPEALSGKIFGYVEYNWEECEWQPYVLLGAEAEFGRGNAAVHQWGILLKGGLSY